MTDEDIIREAACTVIGTQFHHCYVVEVGTGSPAGSDLIDLVLSEKMDDGRRNRIGYVGGVPAATWLAALAVAIEAKKR